jgi:hypothetical protein
VYRYGRLVGFSIGLTIDASLVGLYVYIQTTTYFGSIKPVWLGVIFGLLTVLMAGWIQYALVGRRKKTREDVQDMEIFETKFLSNHVQDNNLSRTLSSPPPPSVVVVH